MKKDMKKDIDAKSPWIITPEMSFLVENFIDLYNYLKNKSTRKNPIMILGPRGIGKSLFVNIYKVLYLIDNPNSEKKILHLNATSIPETLVESELFGYEKGAFTGAVSKKVGLVDEAELLILEEIGDLPRHIQVKLLTFLEDGKFRRVGGVEEKNANTNLQIIATTNKGREEMRPDFYDRFNKFKVTPLCERRTDILYYLLYFVPDIMPFLKPWEIMSLISHAWDGNVREISAVAMDMERGYIKFFQNLPDDKDVRKFICTTLFASSVHSDINEKTIRQRYQSMKNAGINVRLIEKLMNRYGLGIDIQNDATPWINKNFKELVSSDPDDRKRDALFGTKTLKKGIFSDVEKGIGFYRRLFLRNTRSNVNLLSVRSDDGRLPIILSPFKYIKNPTAECEVLAKSILEYCFRQRIKESMRNDSLLDLSEREYSEWVRNAFYMRMAEPEDDTVEQAYEELEYNPLNLPLDDLLCAYYKHLLTKSNGNIKKAAKMAGLKYDTLYSKLKKQRII